MPRAMYLRDSKTSPTIMTKVSTAIAITNVTRKFERM